MGSGDTSDLGLAQFGTSAEHSGQLPLEFQNLHLETGAKQKMSSSLA